ncbi:hypothetical protein H4S08_001708 [Coemansia sp. RSA 1365]|nr:hypothetical protein H4S08_001708 [Coemansia sp. RSA 1365]
MITTDAAAGVAEGAVTRGTDAKDNVGAKDASKGGKGGHRKRARATSEQVSVLESVFAVNRSPASRLREDLAARLGMAPRQVQVWFQNRRAKEKSQQRNPRALQSAPALFDPLTYAPDVYALATGFGAAQPWFGWTLDAKGDASRSQREPEMSGSRRESEMSGITAVASPIGAADVTGDAGAASAVTTPLAGATAFTEASLGYVVPISSAGYIDQAAAYTIPLPLIGHAGPLVGHTDPSTGFTVPPATAFAGFPVSYPGLAATHTGAVGPAGYASASAAFTGPTPFPSGAAYMVLETSRLVVGAWHRVPKPDTELKCMAYVEPPAPRPVARPGSHRPAELDSLVGEFQWLVSSGGERYKMALPFSAVSRIKFREVPDRAGSLVDTASDEVANPQAALAMLTQTLKNPDAVGELVVHIYDAPAFFFHGEDSWRPIGDFSEGHCASAARVHTLVGSFAVLFCQLRVLLATCARLKVAADPLLALWLGNIDDPYATSALHVNWLPYPPPAPPKTQRSASLPFLRAVPSVSTPPALPLRPRASCSLLRRPAPYAAAPRRESDAELAVAMHSAFAHADAPGSRRPAPLSRVTCADVSRPASPGVAYATEHSGQPAQPATSPVAHLAAPVSEANTTSHPTVFNESVMMAIVNAMAASGGLPPPPGYAGGSLDPALLDPATLALDPSALPSTTLALDPTALMLSLSDFKPPLPPATNLWPEWPQSVSAVPQDLLSNFLTPACSSVAVPADVSFEWPVCETAAPPPPADPTMLSDRHTTARPPP